MLNQIVPDFELPATGGEPFRSSMLKGSPAVIYFYPKDDTPGCVAEGQAFRDLYPEFQRLGCRVFGVSRDSLASHEKFKAKMSFPFELLSDTEETACRLFGVVKEKKLYGKPMRGIERSTFVVDRDGVVRREWRGVKVPGHVQEVLDYVKTL